MNNEKMSTLSIRAHEHSEHSEHLFVFSNKRLYIIFVFSNKRFYIFIVFYIKHFCIFAQSLKHQIYGRAF